MTAQNNYELKDYQQEVLTSLEKFLSLTDETQSLREAYARHWLASKIDVTSEEAQHYKLHPYDNTMVPGVPNVTVKVPTAGGKTFIACAALYHIFKHQYGGRPQVVTWFVPSDTILTQTLMNLQDPRHPYRRRLDRDFNGRVNVIGKEDALMAKGLRWAEVQEQLTILVLSVQSFAADSSDNLRARRQNGEFAGYLQIPAFHRHKLKNAENPSLLQVLSFLHPVVVVDESHKFERSELRQDLQRELTPAFILNLTATPRERSNIICFIDSFKLKRENMVKLPVVVYNNQSVSEVISSAIAMQRSLESKAKSQQEQGGDYVRPIVLFQAQANTNDDAETFTKLKAQLVKWIPEEQIAIKTAAVNELKGVELMSADCPIRFIITVNALNEGWDCPFAYILASLANRSSSVEVEQILGRILRQPYARRQQKGVLNASYVFANSADFQSTLSKIVKGLNNSGFSSKDYRIAEPREVVKEHQEQTQSTDRQWELHFVVDYDETWWNNSDGSVLHEGSGQEQVVEIINQMEQQGAQEDERLHKQAQQDDTSAPNIDSGMQMKSEMLPQYREVASGMVIPSFAMKVQPDAFGELSEAPLTKGALSQGFKLSQCDRHIDFNSQRSAAFKIDLDRIGEDEYRPAQFQLNDQERMMMNEALSAYGKESLVSHLTKVVVNRLDEFNSIGARELRAYVKGTLEGRDIDELRQLASQDYSTVEAFKTKIRELVLAHRRRQFKEWLITEKTFLSTANGVGYHFPKSIPVIKEAVGVKRSLYLYEQAVNGFEDEVVRKIMDEDNVFFWHRNERDREFCINGFIHHYPDFIIRLRSGKTLLVETKGKQFKDTIEAKDRIELGRSWAEKAGSDFRYFMVFQQQPMEGGISVEQLLGYIRSL